MVAVTTQRHNIVTESISVTKGAGRNGIPKRAEAAETGRLLSAALNTVALSLHGLLQQVC